MIRGGDKTQLSESVWASIRNKGPLLVLAGSRSVSTKSQDDDDMHGIRKGRSFRVVSCIETSKIKLMQLVDPMIGKVQSKWDGPFSAESKEWTPSLREAAAKVTIDGGFWMSFSDFIVLFDNMWTCTVPCTNQQMRMNESILAFAGATPKARSHDVRTNVLSKPQTPNPKPQIFDCRQSPRRRRSSGASTRG